MRTVQMTLDEDLVREVDAALRETGETRSAFTRTALRMALDRRRTELLEQRHRVGYAKQPVTDDEFGVWEDEQAWGSP